jgi:hypothetical protein
VFLLSSSFSFSHASFVRKAYPYPCCNEGEGCRCLYHSDTDPHISEYVPDCWRILEWITGFNGSAGTLVITVILPVYGLIQDMLFSQDNSWKDLKSFLLSPNPGKRAASGYGLPTILIVAALYASTEGFSLSPVSIHSDRQLLLK